MFSKEYCGFQKNTAAYLDTSRGLCIGRWREDVHHCGTGDCVWCIRISSLRLDLLDYNIVWIVGEVCDRSRANTVRPYKLPAKGTVFTVPFLIGISMDCSRYIPKSRYNLVGFVSHGHKMISAKWVYRFAGKPTVS